MPHFCFDIADGSETGIDDEGLELPSLTEARKAALATLGEIACEELPDGDCRNFIISIRDENGDALLKATLALRVETTAAT